MRQLSRLLILAAALGATQAPAQQHLDPTKPLPPISAPAPLDYPGVITLEVDATQLTHRLLQVTQTIPVKPGHMVLYFLVGYRAPTDPTAASINWQD